VRTGTNSNQHEPSSSCFSNTVRAGHPTHPRPRPAASGDIVNIGPLESMSQGRHTARVNYARPAKSGNFTAFTKQLGPGKGPEERHHLQRDRAPVHPRRDNGGAPCRAVAGEGSSLKKAKIPVAGLGKARGRSPPCGLFSWWAKDNAGVYHPARRLSINAGQHMYLVEIKESLWPS